MARQHRMAQLNTQYMDECAREVLSTENGRAFVFNILAQCGIYTPSFSGDRGYTDFNEGKRSLGCWVINEIHRVDPYVYPKMQTEAAAREIQFKLRVKSNTKP